MHDEKKSHCGRYGCLYIIMYMSTCRPADLVLLTITKIRLGLGLVWGYGLVGLGLGLTVDIQIGTIMTINEDHTPILIGRQVDRSTIKFWQHR